MMHAVPPAQAPVVSTVSPRTQRHGRLSGGSNESRMSSSMSNNSETNIVGSPNGPPSDTSSNTNSPTSVSSNGTNKPTLGRLLSTGRTPASATTPNSARVNGPRNSITSRKPSVNAANMNGNQQPQTSRVSPTTQTANGTAPVPFGSSKKPTGAILNALNGSGKKGSWGSSGTASPARGSLERITSSQQQNGRGGHLISPPSSLRKPSFSRADSRFRRPSITEGKDNSSIAPAPRERIGRNGQPLQRRQKNGISLEQTPSAIQAYILNTRGQLGLEPERAELRFDPLADDESDHEPAALIMPASPATVASIQSRERQGSRIIHGVLAAKRAGKTWRPDASEGGVVHIAAGVVLPPLAAASLASGVLLHARTPSSSSSGSSARNSKNKKASPTGSQSAASATHALQAQPSPVAAQPSLPPNASIIPAVSPSDLALSTARRTSWEMEHPDARLDAAAHTTRAERIAAEERERERREGRKEERQIEEESKTPASPSGTHALVVSSGSHPSVAAALPAPIQLAAPSAAATPHTSQPGTPSGGGDGTPYSGLNPRRRRSLELEETEAQNVKEPPNAMAIAVNNAPLSPTSAALASSSNPPTIPLRRKSIPRSTNTPTNASGPSGSPTDSQQAKQGKIERKPSSFSGASAATSPQASPAVQPQHSGSAATIPSQVLPPAANGVSISVNPTTSIAIDSGSFQTSNSASMSPDAVQDRWRRNLMKRMSVNISFAPSPFSGLLGPGAAPAQESRSPSSGGAAPKGGSFSKESSGASGGGMLSVNAPEDAGRTSQLGFNSKVSIRGSMNRMLSHDREAGIGAGRRASMRDVADQAQASENISGERRPAKSHSRQSSLTQSHLASIAKMNPRASLTLQRSIHVSHPPPLAVQQTNSNSDGATQGDAQPYPQNPQFSFLFPHQELLAQQREYYDTCNKKLLEYLLWNDDQHMDPVIVPASAHPFFSVNTQYHHPQRHSHGASSSSLPNPLMSPTSPNVLPSPPPVPIGYPIPPSLPTSFDQNFWSCYSSIQHWETFDVFNWSEYTQGWPLSFMFVVVLKKSDLFRKLKLDEKVAFRFIQEVESHYLPNPYHTSIHAADVLHAVYHFLNDSILRDQISDVDKFLLYFSCAIHDFAHPGVNNTFLINTRAPLAIRYNDRHVLEAFHVSSAFRMMQLTSGCNILEAWDYESDPKIYARCRKMIIDMVLATDLAQHFDLLRIMKGKFENLMANATTGKGDSGSGNSPTSETVSSVPTPTAASTTERNSGDSLPRTIPSPSSSISEVSSSPPPPHTQPSPSSSTSSSFSAPPSSAAPFNSGHLTQVPWLNLTADEDITLVLQMLLKLGDLSHPARPKMLHLRWAELVTEEFFSQGDRERSLNLTPSMFMDRHTTNVATSQLGFLTFLVQPLFVCASKLQSNNYWVRKVERNLDLWRDLEEIEKREQAQKDAEERAAAGITQPETDSGSNSTTNSLTAATDLTELFERNKANRASGSTPPLKSTTPPKVRTSPTGAQSVESSVLRTPSFTPQIDSGVDLSIYPPHHHHHHGSASSSTSSALSSGSGSITGRFSSVCKDRTVLSMFQKVREIGSHDDDSDEPLPHEHAHFMSAVDGENNESSSRPESVSALRLPVERQESVIPLEIAEEPTSPRHFNDGSLPTTPMPVGMSVGGRSASMELSPPILAS